MDENKKVNKLIQLVKNNVFSIDYTTDNDSVLVNEKINNYLFEFIVYYEINYYDVISSTYYNPEEFSVSFKPKKIGDFVIYDNKNNIVELSNKEYDLIQYEIENIIL